MNRKIKAKKVKDKNCIEQEKLSGLSLQIQFQLLYFKLPPSILPQFGGSFSWAA